MVCEYEFKVTVTIIILAIVIRYIIYKYTPEQYFYDEIEIKQCKRYMSDNMSNNYNKKSEEELSQSQDSCTSCNNYKRLNDIDMPYNN